MYYKSAKVKGVVSTFCYSLYSQCSQIMGKRNACKKVTSFKYKIEVRKMHFVYQLKKCSISQIQNLEKSTNSSYRVHKIFYYFRVHSERWKYVEIILSDRPDVRGGTNFVTRFVLNITSH